MINTYKHEVFSLFVNNVGVGFLVRRYVLFPSGDLTPDNEWYATRDLLDPEWIGGFKTRREARQYLEGIRNN